MRSMKLIENVLKCGCIRFSSSEIFTRNTASCQIFFRIPRKNSVISLLNGCLDLNFDVLHAATGNRYADGNVVS